MPILEYHDITYIKNDPFAMSPTQFASEMDFLKARGFHAVTLDQVYAAMTGHAKLPRRPVVITFESHTVDHPHLTQLNPAQLWREVAQSKETLSKDFGRPVLFFCYPYGDYNNRVIRAVKQAGYLLATTTNEGYADPMVDGPYCLRRIAIHQGLSLRRFAALLHTSLPSSAVLGPSFARASA
ncbi:polysaccharide deacetylase family protein [Alicyclobacillus pomorum]|uniref:polysaccharide deacetylase family protein n=1 Tax=Alicyclobacillus pomorum TaxID=204470 RepID=UPI00040DECAC|nr:polysaccharide deacetylase family protein [Alicyclobacillus pomorum]